MLYVKLQTFVLILLKKWMLIPTLQPNLINKTINFFVRIFLLFPAGQRYIVAFNKCRNPKVTSTKTFREICDCLTQFYSPNPLFSLAFFSGSQLQLMESQSI